MTKRVCIFLLLVLPGLILTGCGAAQRCIEGRVTNLTHEEERVETVTGTRPMTVGKVTVCMPYTRTVVVPESWKVHFVDGKGRERQLNTEEDCWLSLSVGDTIKFDRWDGTIEIMEGVH